MNKKMFPTSGGIRRSILCIWLLAAGCLAAGGMLTACSRSEPEVVIKPLPPSAHNWAIAADALVALAYDCQRLELLGWDEPTPENVARWKDFLKNYWGIENKKDLLRNVEWLKAGGHRKQFEADAQRFMAMTSEELLKKIQSADEATAFKTLVVARNYEALGDKSIIGWDYMRIIHIAGWSCLVGYITEEEAWEIIMPTAQILQYTFDSWDDLGRNYMIGREYWSLEQTRMKGQKFRDAHQRLLEDPQSPYNTIPWDMSLEF